ncbi:MAG: ABC transporter ATP-binding protein [Lachnospiraceae bacterium]|nr:ABC transporter ATP-binding protein [Lachnospiraceae bacterium]
MSEYAFRFDNVTKRKHGFLQKVSFALPTGTIMALIGPNGAGKTTTIRTLVGISGFDSGELTMFDHDVREGKLEDKDKLSVVLDDIPFGDTYTADQIEYVLSGIYSSWDADLFQQYLRRFHLVPTTKIKEYSKGMKQKLQIAFALSHNAKLLVLDEPLANLDPASKEEVMESIMEYMQEGDRSVLITTNTPADIEAYADWVTVILGGTVIITEERDSLLERHGMIHCSNQDASKIDPAFIVASRRSLYGTNILIRSRERFVAQYPDIALDTVTLDDILIYYQKGSEVTQ